MVAVVEEEGMETDLEEDEEEVEEEEETLILSAENDRVLVLSRIALPRTRLNSCSGAPDMFLVCTPEIFLVCTQEI